MPDIQNLGAFRLFAGARGKPGWIVQRWWVVQSILFRPSPQFLFAWRRFLLRAFGAQVRCPSFDTSVSSGDLSLEITDN
jgi:hypothetical protein